MVVLNSGTETAQGYRIGNNKTLEINYQTLQNGWFHHFWNKKRRIQWQLDNVGASRDDVSSVANENRLLP